MSFFDKFFRNKICSNKNENELKINNEIVKSSNLCISKEHIRFLLFRECDKRGRKLLFDSDAVERISLPLKGIDHSKNRPLPDNKKDLDCIESTTTHGYKFKKQSDDIACLGEMIFGSVAMTYRGENSCKIHKILSPKKLMFTTIIYSPLRCHIGSTSECSSESSNISIKDALSTKDLSSSDSKLSKPIANIKKGPSTYPCMKNTLGFNKLVHCCEVKEIEKSVKNNIYLTRDDVSESLDKITNGNENTECVSSGVSKLIANKINSEQDILMLNFSQNSSGCEQNSSCNTNSAASLISYDSENVSSVSGSLSSLRRRWAPSNSTSLDVTAQEDACNTPCKKRTKLGVVLVLDISKSSNECELETFIFNHTILIESIMNKFRSCVESAYTKNQNFLDVLYTAFLDAQQNIYDFITGEKYKIPFWMALLGDSDDYEGAGDINAGGENNVSGACYGSGDLKFSLKQFSSPVKLKKTSKEQTSSNNAKIKFLNDFYDVLVRFDTKDTNFFISTLLTAVLTHHLSWVTAIAETDSSNRQEKTQSVIKDYNPIWAQLNDLCGLLGSPLRYARTIIKGSESKKYYITTILSILTYFIRCFNVVENIYDVNIEDAIEKVANSVEVANHRGGFDSRLESSTNSEALHLRTPILDHLDSSNENEDREAKIKLTSSGKNEQLEISNHCNLGGSLRRKKAFSCLNTHDTETLNRIYPVISNTIKKESIYAPDPEDVKDKEVKDTVDNKDLMAEGSEKISPTFIEIERTGHNSKHYFEEHFSPDEGYDTIDSSKADCLCTAATTEMAASKPGVKDTNSDIVFVLGDNEKLVNIRKKVIFTESNTMGLKNEGLKECAQEPENVQQVNQCKENCPTFDNGSENFSERKSTEDNVRRVSLNFLELKMPGTTKPSQRKCLGVCSVLGGVNRRYNSEQIIQGLIDPEAQWEENLQKDLYLCGHNSTLEKNISEALCIVGDVDSWEVTVRSSTTSVLDRKKSSGVRVGMSQLVADMLESFLAIHKINLPPSFCLLHIEKKLREIYLKSKTVAELLISTDLCTIDYLTTRLDIGISDIPLLLSVATTHSPQISEKYGLSFT